MTSGSLAAQGGLDTEKTIILKFNNWTNDPDVPRWLNFMGYSSPTVSSVKAVKPNNQGKTDVLITVEREGLINRELLSIKTTKSESGGNQLTRFWPSVLKERYGLNDNLITILRNFTGETWWTEVGKKPRRIMLNRIPKTQQADLIKSFGEIKLELIRWMFMGAEPIRFFLSVYGESSDNFLINKMEDVVAHYSKGPVVITPRGGLRVGRVTLQRKGGDKGAFSACQLQSKININQLWGI